MAASTALIIGLITGHGCRIINAQRKALANDFALAQLQQRGVNIQPLPAFNTSLGGNLAERLELFKNSGRQSG